MKPFNKIREYLNSTDNCGYTPWESFKWEVGDKYSSFTAFFRGIWYSSKQLWYWFPIIWVNRDWDQWYIYEMLYHKIKKTRDNLDKFQRHIGVEDKVAHMDYILSQFKYVSEEEWLLDEQLTDDDDDTWMEKAWAEYETRTRLFMEICDNINGWWD